MNTNIQIELAVRVANVAQAMRDQRQPGLFALNALSAELVTPVHVMATSPKWSAL